MAKGEARLLIEQLKEISADVLEKLKDLDAQLADMEGSIKDDDFNKDTLLERIAEIRQSIGSIEKEDSEEMEDEAVLLELLRKLDSLLESVLDTE
jgi:septal ring factor EnvC (AmiA/AmiB activator)